MLLLPLMTACQTLTAANRGEGPRFYCGLADPITYSSKDTAQTKREVRAHNGEYNDVCDREPEADK